MPEQYELELGVMEMSCMVEGLYQCPAGMGCAGDRHLFSGFLPIPSTGLRASGIATCVENKGCNVVFEENLAYTGCDAP